MVADLVIRIGAKSDQFKKELDAVKSQTKALDAQLGKIAKTSAIAFAALSAVIGTTIVKFAKFESKFSDVETLLDDTSFSSGELQDNIDALKDEVLELGIASGETFDVLNKALFNVVSAGIKGEDAMKVLTDATRLATAGATNTIVAVDGITTAINAFGFEAEDATAISAKFFLAQKFGKTTVEELAQGLGKVTGLADAMGTSFEEVLAAVSAATLAGVETTRAYTGLNAIFVGVTTVTSEAAAEAERLGIAFSSDALRAAGGLQPFLESITSATGFTSSSIEKLFGSVEALSIALNITGKTAQQFNDITKALGDDVQATEVFLNALKIKMGDLAFATDQAKSGLEAASIVLGEQFAPATIEVANTIRDLSLAFIKLDDETLGTISSILAWAAALAGGVTALALFLKWLIFVKNSLAVLKLGLLFTSVAAKTFWKAILGPIGLAVVLFANIALGVAVFVEKFRDADTVVGDIARSLLKRFNQLKEGVSDLIDSFTEFLGIGGDESPLDQDAMDSAKDEAAEKARKLKEEEAVLEAVREEARQIALEAKILAEEEEKARQEEEREAALALLLEQNNFDITLLEEHLGRELTAQEAALAKKILANKAAHDKIIKQDEDAAKKKLASERLLTDNVLALADELVDGSSGAGKALFLISKGVAIARSIVATQLAIAEANALPPLISPPFVARAALIGNLATATIAATAITSLAAAHGGEVPFVPGGRRDRVNMSLQPGEIVIPKPLVPTFKQRFGDLQEGVNGGEKIKVEIELQGEAAQLFTARQKENTRIGVAE